jgi:hypothetical protein
MKLPMNFKIAPPKLLFSQEGVTRARMTMKRENTMVQSQVTAKAHCYAAPANQNGDGAIYAS